MAKQSAITKAIEKAEAEIGFQQRLIDALRATQKAQGTTTKRTKKVTLKPPEFDVAKHP